MPDEGRGRMQFYVFDKEKLITIRVIGDMSSVDFIRNLFGHLDSVAEPWTYNRIMDFRRFTAVLSADEIEEMGRAWTEHVPADAPRTKLAVVSKDVPENSDEPTVSPTAPSRVVCHFSKYHDALQWVLCGSPAPATVDAQRWGVDGHGGGEYYID